MGRVAEDTHRTPWCKTTPRIYPEKTESSRPWPSPSVFQRSLRPSSTRARARAVLTVKSFNIGMFKSTVPGLLYKNAHGDADGGSTIAYKFEVSDVEWAAQDKRTGLRIYASVRLLGVTIASEAMKFPRAKFASFAGTIRCSEISYGCCATTVGSATSAYGTCPSLDIE